MGLQVELLEQSFAAVAPKANELADRFYATLFQNYPEVKPLFAGVTMPEQKQKLIASLQLIVQSLRNSERLVSLLEKMGQRHVYYGTEPEHYPAVGETLLTALAETAGDAWTPELHDAWAEAYGEISKIMIAATAVAV